ncbi:hypothetical protein NUITMVRE34_00700 [Enterococcus gallinarum]|uniref:hypothetical protein n=1 Tax=Enterococcus gallinarum TaxID=1353 RepID=UPI0028FDB37A|nr:hypothetical protein NUITMVRE34_00700 [Enterococcus gallinarum]GMS50412.1 hypothetical protein NUITMVRE35_05470 [Enterococcus gallinarum]
MKEQLIVFFPPYKKGHFYQLMGPFFAERIYQKQFPYLVNYGDCHWYVIVDSLNQVMGFSYYEKKTARIEIGEFYEKEPASGRKTLLLRKMLHDIRKKHPDQEITVTTSHPNEVALFQTKGFTVFRQTKNYYFLKRECSV